MLTTLQAPLTAAVRSARELCRVILAREVSSRCLLRGLLADTANAVEGCPNFTPAEMVYFRNRFASSRRLLEQREWGAAHYEMTELSRKLARAKT